jgi:outer membrane protein TolC
MWLDKKMPWFSVILILISMPLLGQNSQLDSLLEIGRKSNPILKARSLQFQAAQSLVPAAGALPDPVIGISMNNLPINTFDFNQEPMTGKKISLTQAIPFPGKLGLKEKIFEQLSQKSKWEYEESQLQVDFAIKKLYYRIHFLDRALEIVIKNQKVLENFIRIAQTKYAVGKGIQQDVLKAQVEYSRFYDKIIQLQQEREGLVANLNALLNRPSSTPLPNTATLSEKTIVLQLDSLQKIALENNPTLRKIQAILKQSQYKTKLARKNFLPDFSISIAYTQREQLQNGLGGIDYVSGTIGLKIPVYFWRKQSKELESAKYQEKSVSYTLEDVQNRILANIADAYQRFTKQIQLIDLYRNSIIPQATQSFNSAVSGYETDKVDFLTLLNNLMVLFNYEKDYYKVLTDYYIQLAQLEYLVGKELK